MSNLINEQLRGTYPEVCLATPEASRVQSAARHLGANAVHFGDGVGFADIFSGKVYIDLDTEIYDSNGTQLDTADLLTQVERSVEVQSWQK